MPKLKVNHEYYIKIKDGVVAKDEKEFIKNEIESATTIVKGIEQRAITIIKVAKAIENLGGNVQSFKFTQQGLTTWTSLSFS